MSSARGGARQRGVGGVRVGGGQRGGRARHARARHGRARRLAGQAQRLQHAGDHCYCVFGAFKEYFSLFVKLNVKYFFLNDLNGFD